MKNIYLLLPILVALSAAGCSANQNIAPDDDVDDSSFYYGGSYPPLDNDANYYIQPESDNRYYYLPRRPVDNGYENIIKNPYIPPKRGEPVKPYTPDNDLDFWMYYDFQ